MSLLSDLCATFKAYNVEVEQVEAKVAALLSDLGVNDVVNKEEVRNSYVGSTFTDADGEIWRLVAIPPNDERYLQVGTNGWLRTIDVALKTWGPFSRKLEADGGES